jgi:hypothetical protein
VEKANGRGVCVARKAGEINRGVGNAAKTTSRENRGNKEEHMTELGVIGKIEEELSVCDFSIKR